MRRCLALVMTLFALGCGPEDHERASIDKYEAEGVTFEPHTGLSVPDETAKFIGLKIAAIEERAMGGSEKVVTVPNTALLKTVEGNFVYTVSGDRFIRTPVKIGKRDPTHVEITDGLYAGDHVAIHPVMTLWLAELQYVRGGKACADGH